MNRTPSLPVLAYNVRVYGILIENDCLLVSDEVYKGMQMTKFAGGGVVLGEGLEAALCREFEEEHHLSVGVERVFYVNTFLQLSAFNPQEQLIALYFFIKTETAVVADISATPFVFGAKVQNAQRLRWLPLKALEVEQFTFPTDRQAAREVLRYIGGERS
ncbi:MAG: NUDIX domain-containing protein [Sphingobacteriales bacterium]|nr:NUDIX domain-containing protein [Sphingobacteriales bacterium]